MLFDSYALLRLLLFFALILMAGFFAGSETALFSLSQVQLMRMRQNGHPRASLLQALLDNPRRLIATIFIGNEFVNIGASAIMASLANRVLVHHGQFVVSMISTGISVTLILFVGEITPKNLAVRLGERWAVSAARPLWLLAVLFAPLRLVIEKIADLVVRLVARRVSPEKERLGENEFLSMVDAVKDEGKLDPSEHQMIHNVFEFGDLTVGDVMTHEPQVFALSYNLPLSRILDEVKKSIYSRIPVYQGSRDRIVGVLYLKDLLPVAHGAQRQRLKLTELLHPGYFVPRKTRCEQLFREFRRRRTHLALVVDEYGHFVGLVTMEDLLEELFGEIWDEKEVSVASVVSGTMDGALARAMAEDAPQDSGAGNSPTAGPPVEADPAVDEPIEARDSDDTPKAKAAPPGSAGEDPGES